jgi:hypothetical protein
MAQRESELTTTIRHLQEELQQLRKHSHGSIGFVQNGSIMTSAISTSSLASVGTNLVSSGLSTHSKSSGDLESLTKEQLIQRCQREIQLKEAVSL